MEISHASTETQSAAVGIKGKAEEVTVSTDAEFMMMIAHGIYSNKPLALVRELLCNARDGHAKAGCLDKPITITLTENKLVVRDHGTGIPNAIFAPTYLTFGKSTKRKDKSATGGFGVGSKVPWAVCDTFSARNFIDGTMTVYSITKSDPKLDGKPSCTPVMSVPSQEPSGVEVSVPFPEKMHDDIKRTVELFAMELSIPVNFNGRLLQPTNDFGGKELKELGFFRAPRHPTTVIQHTPFYVRQGDVLYPVECQEEFEDAWNMLLAITPPHSGPLILMAKPDSIIPTLSRESLQYTERTSFSIRDLMKDALQDIATHIDNYAERVDQAFPTAFGNSESFLLDYWHGRYELAEELTRVHNRARDPKLSDTQNDMLYTNVKRWLKGNTPYLETKVTIGQKFRETQQAKVDVFFRQQLKSLDYFDYNKLIQLFEHNKEKRLRFNYSNPSLDLAIVRNAYEEFMFWRAEMRANNEIVEVYYPSNDTLDRTHYSPSSLFTMTTSINERIDKEKERYFSGGGGYRQTMTHGLYLSKTVVISHQPITMLQRATEVSPKPTMKGNMYVHGRLAFLTGARCIRVRAQTRPEKIEEMKKEYEALGYKVLTYLAPTRAELAERAAMAEERAKLKEIPLPTLDGLIGQNLPTYPEKAKVMAKKKLRGLMSNETFKGKPLYLILNRGKELPMAMNSVNDFYRLSKFVGTDIVCVSTKPEIAKVIKEGRVNLDDALLEFAKWFFGRRDIYEKLFWRNTMFSRRANKNRLLTKYLFNVDVPVMTPQEEMFYKSLVEFSRFCPKLSEYVKAKVSYFDSCCTSEKHYDILFDRYAEQNFCDVHRALEKAYSSTPSPKRALARSILKTILKERPA